MLTKLKTFLPSKNEKKFDFKYKIENNNLIVDINFFLYRYDLIGKSVKFKFLNECIVKKDRPVNGKKVIYQDEFIVDSEFKTIRIKLDDLNGYTYKGISIDSKFKIFIETDDKVFFDTKLDEEITRRIIDKTDNIRNASKLINPYDRFDAISSFKALSFTNKFFISCIGFVILFLLYIFSSILVSILFFHLLLVLGSFIFFIWLGIKKLFQNYMSFKLKTKHFFEYSDKKYKLSEIVTGESRVDLHNITVRVVASNVEKGQHVVSSGKSSYTKSFINPVNGLILHSEKIDFVPKNTNINNYIKGSFSFDEMYKKLYPPMKLGYAHGVDVAWEIQILNNDLVDKKIKCPIDFFSYNHFLNK